MKRALVCAMLPALGQAAASKEAATELLPRHRLRQKALLAHPRSPAVAAKASEADEEEEEAPLVPPVKQLVVPAPADSGPDGYPQLPAVSKMLDTAESTMKSISSQASNLEKRVVQAQMEKAAKMSRQKTVFEKKLRGQEEENRALVSANDQITKDIAKLKSGNDAIKKHAQELQASNALMRNELQALAAKLGAARDFVSASLQATDDSKAQELRVLQPHGPRQARHAALTEVHGVDAGEAEASGGGATAASAASSASVEETSDTDGQNRQEDGDAGTAEGEDDDDDAPDAPSLLALATRVTRAADPADPADAGNPDTPAAVASNPRDMLSVLAEGVEALAKQEHSGESQLKSLFLRDFQAGAKRHAALVSQQQLLNASHAAATVLQARLRKAELRLESTEKHLGERLRGVGLFVQKLSHLALAPAEEAPRLMQALPGSVALAPKQAGAGAPAGATLATADAAAA